MHNQSHNQSQTDTPHLTAKLTESLLEDLLDPAMTPILICQIHGLTLPKLTALIQSDDYRAAVDAIETINAARRSTIESQTHLQAISSLKEAADLAQLKEDHESLRKSSTTLLRITAPQSTAIKRLKPKPDIQVLLNKNLTPNNSCDSINRMYLSPTPDADREASRCHPASNAAQIGTPHEYQTSINSRRPRNDGRDLRPSRLHHRRLVHRPRPLRR